MIIKNLKSEFSTDQYSDTEVFSILLADEVVEGIKKRRELLALNKWLTDNTTIEYTPIGIGIRDSEICDDTITVRIGLDAMLFIVTDDNGTMYETESVPYVALDKERFLLYLTDDREVVEYEDRDDIDDFMAIYADSIKEATNEILEMTAEARKGFGEQEDADHIREEILKNPGKYRFLEAFEQIEDGDEELIDGRWERTGDATLLLGPNAAKEQLYRRPITEPRCRILEVGERIESGDGY